MTGGSADGRRSSGYQGTFVIYYFLLTIVEEIRVRPSTALRAASGFIGGSKNKANPPQGLPDRSTPFGEVRVDSGFRRRDGGISTFVTKNINVFTCFHMFISIVFKLLHVFTDFRVFSDTFSAGTGKNKANLLIRRREVRHSVELCRDK